MKKILPLIEMRIDPENGSFVSAISIVNNPAIKSNFVAFSNDEPQHIAFADEKMELIGAAMIPGLPMYRNTKDVGEYMSVFDSETIRQIAQVFAEKGFFNNMNIAHDSDAPAGSFVFQSFIVDSSKGILSPTGIDAPDGSWIIGVKVIDPILWGRIKAGEVSGFSVEGLFGLFDTDLTLTLGMSEEIKAAIAFDDMLQSIPKGCLMFVPEVDKSQWELKARQIAPGANQLELEPHVTILYGFPDSPDNIPALRSFLADALNVSPLNIELGNISKFTGGEEDVIKIGINDCNGTLTAINAILSDMFSIVSDYGKYTPHMTVAYTTPDPATVFSSDVIWPWELGINYINKGCIIYSDANRVQTELLKIK